MEAAVQPRAGLASIKPYEAGEAKIDGLDSVIKLSSNESPFGPGPAARDSLRNAWDGLGRYPSSDHAALRQAIQKAHGFDAQRIVCGAGSDEILGLLAQAFCEPGAEVVYTRHGFLMYPIFARAVGAVPIQAEEPERKIDVSALLDVCTARTRLIYLANPSNPTGNMLADDDLVKLADSLDSNMILVVDGAYAEFADGHDMAARLAETRCNVVVTRTFSKIHGLAALRIGYGYGPPDIIDAVARIRAPFNVSGPAQMAATAAVGDHEHVRFCQQHNERWRYWLRSKLCEAGLAVDESLTNFVLARFAGDTEADECDRWLRSCGIIVRKMTAYQLGDCLRISIGSESACRAVAASITDFIAHYRT